MLDFRRILDFLIHLFLHSCIFGYFHFFRYFILNNCIFDSRLLAMEPMEWYIELAIWSLAR